MTTREISISRQCSLCGKGPLEEGKDVALFRYDTKTKKVLTKPPNIVELIPCRVMRCANCGYLVLFSAKATKFKH